MATVCVGRAEAVSIFAGLRCMEGSEPGFNEVERTNAEKFLKDLNLLSESESITAGALNKLISGLADTIKNTPSMPFKEEVEEDKGCSGSISNIGTYGGHEVCTVLFDYSIEITLTSSDVAIFAMKNKLAEYDCFCRRVGPIL